jgi:glycosyltransferase involved in cell wall biosynthesis
VRILHVDPERGWGGGEVQVTTLVGELARRGHESVVAAPAGSPLAAAVAALGVRVEPCAIRNHWDLRAVPRLRRLARDVDVVHFHTARAHAMAPWIGGRARRVVTRRMDYAPRGGAWTRYLYNGAVDGVIAISQGVRAALLRSGVRFERIRVVPSGIDVDAFAPPSGARERVRAEWDAAVDDVVVVLMGVLELRKGHRVLLDAAREVPPGLRLRYVFCGAGRQESSLKERVAAERLPVHFAGFRRDVAACLAAADIAVLPSLHEGLGVAALEAMAAGRSVVASRTGGLIEVVVDGDTGRLVQPDDAPALARALTVLASDPEARRAMGVRGTARVRERFSGAAMAEGTLACYGRTP